MKYAYKKEVSNCYINNILFMYVIQSRPTLILFIFNSNNNTLRKI